MREIADVAADAEWHVYDQTLAERLITSRAFEGLIDAGIARLDERVPEWRTDLNFNLDRLDLGNCTRCVLGQAFVGFSRGLAALGLKGTGDGPAAAWRFGFEHGLGHPGFERLVVKALGADAARLVGTADVYLALTLAWEARLEAELG